MEKPRSTVAPLHQMAFTRLELAVMSLVNGQLQILLARHADTPAAGKWDLPAGALRTDAYASLELAAQRVSRERLNRELPFIRQPCAVGGKEDAGPPCVVDAQRGLPGAGAGRGI